MQKKALGRGLDAILPEKYIPESRQEHFREIPIENVIPNRYQPRQDAEGEDLAGLAESIRARGVLEPILVREAEGGCYELIAGERRWRAARMAGLRAVPAIVRRADGVDSLEIALIENLLRKDLNPIEEAQAYRRLMTEFALSQEEIARRVGKDRSSVANALRVLGLPDEIQEALRSGRLAMGHAKAILSIKDPDRQRELAREIVEGRLSVRRAERLAGQAPRRPSTRPASPVTPELHAVQERLAYRLGTRVRLNGSEAEGQIVIEYYTREDLERILEVVLAE